MLNRMQTESKNRALYCVSGLVKAAKILGNKRGMAVIMALSIVLLLITTVLGLHFNERTALLNAAAMRNRTSLKQMAISGIHLAMAVLIKDKLTTENDSVQEDWADKETMATFASAIPFKNGTLEVTITDEMSKIQINALINYGKGGNTPDEDQYKIWMKLAQSLTTAIEAGEEEDIIAIGDFDDDIEPQELVNNILDWLDIDTEGSRSAGSGGDGAENDYYESLDPPYKCKNGPFDHLSEISLVKGITPELFAGLGGAGGLSDYITVYGAMPTSYGVQDDDPSLGGGLGFLYPGNVNINTIELPVLKALLETEHAIYAQNLIDYRTANTNGQYNNILTGENWYQNVPGLSDTKLSSQPITYASNFFKIVSKAKSDDMIIESTAIIQRDKQSEKTPWKCKILNWETQ
ncbi:MAG: general secretion pathway protein GspK [Desulfobacteraceae bacterium]|nr:general secretion pathway protein GspK [Desulfobacteraceae bacterium]